MWATLIGPSLTPLPVISRLGSPLGSRRFHAGHIVAGGGDPRLYGGSAVLNGAVGAGSATAAVVSIRNAPEPARGMAFIEPRASRRLLHCSNGAYSLPATAFLASKISCLEAINLAAESFLRSAQPVRSPTRPPVDHVPDGAASIIEMRRRCPFCDDRPREPGLASPRGRHWPSYALVDPSGRSSFDRN